MQLTYVVHSATPDRVAVPSKTADGRPVDGTVQGLTVELVTEDGGHGHTWRFGAETYDHAAAVRLFAPGARVSVSFSAAAAPAPSAPAEA